MTTISFDVVGFDLDGTLLDTSGDLAAAVNHALTVAGRPTLSVAEVRPMIGGGAKHMLAQAMAATGGCSEQDLHRLYKQLLGFYADHIAVHTVPFPGALEAVDALRAQGVKVGIATNKFEAMAQKLLVDLGLRDRFDALIGGDTMGAGLAKPNRAPIDEMVRRCSGGRAAFVGDSIYDIKAARNAGLPSIAVSFGFLQQPVGTLGADLVIDRYADLLPALQRLGR